MTIRAVIFDLGGVVLGSPLHAIAAYEKDLGIPENFINRVVSSTAPTGAWSRLERGEISMAKFFDDFEADCRAAGREISASTMMERMAEAAAPRPAMLNAIGRIREHGLRVAALTNNWATDDSRQDLSDGTRQLREQFDVFVESSAEGLRKPDPRIYQLVCDRLGVRPNESAFLDDIGANLKTARNLGMTTIKVVEPSHALGELGEILGVDLLPGG